MTFVVAAVPFFLTAAIAGALAGLVFYHGPHRLTNRALATLMLATAAGAFGNGMGAATSAVAGEYLSNGWATAGTAVTLVAFASSLPLAFGWPAPRVWAPRFLARLWPFAAAGLLLAFAAVHVRAFAVPGSDGLLSWKAMVTMGVHAIVLLSLAAAILLLVEARRDQEHALRDGRILIALGLGLNTVYAAASALVFLPELVMRVTTRGSAWWISVAYALLVGLLAVAYGLAIARLPASRAARLARGFLLGAVAAGVLDSLTFYMNVRWHLPWAPGYEVALFLYAFWILVPIALLAYVVLRGQIRGLDVKVRWGLSKSTIAAAFVAAFFVASEGAQIVFGQGNEWVGLFAAGALVFAIAPLQRAAERLAAKAVPVETSGSAPGSSPDGRESRFRAAIRLASRDRHLSREEERTLTLLALDLGLTAERAYSILDEEAAGMSRDATPLEAPP